MSTSQQHAPPPPPDEWPREVRDLYEPIRIIGRGGFACVWMAREKKESSAPTPTPTHVVGGGDDDRRGGGGGGGEDGKHVAIKIMRDGAYAEREVAILAELSSLARPHPNIVRILRDFKSDIIVSSRGGGGTTRCAVLSLERGPTLNFVLTNGGGCGGGGGSLGLVVARGISRQLIGAVAFLHGHAVIHRDIQPANIIVSGGVGAMMDDDLWYSDELDVDGKVSDMARRTRITLVDFGFARALGPRDIDEDIGLRKIADERRGGSSSTTATAAEAGDHGECVSVVGHPSCCSIDRALEDATSHGGGGVKGGGRSSGNADDSISRRSVLDLSAVGTRSYAAPEILSGIRSIVADGMSTSSLRRSKTHSSSSATAAAHHHHRHHRCVSSYGMVADAYSVGATVRHMVTGVPPNVDVQDFIDARDHPLAKLGRCLGGRLLPGKRNRRGRRANGKRYRASSDLPGDVKGLIRDLTHYDSRRRATVRSMTRHPWIVETSSSSSSSSSSCPEAEHGGPIAYLKCGGG